VKPHAGLGSSSAASGWEVSVGGSGAVRSRRYVEVAAGLTRFAASVARTEKV
jgi:hypothetical protein